jgi:enterochelin esterase-like enzyme/outer membrane protein assembly factor BamB
MNIERIRRFVAPAAGSLVLALFVLSAPPTAADWTRWLGPTQDGRTTGLGVEPGKPVAFEVTWKRPLGLGYTGIAVAGSRMITMYADGTSDWVVAVDTRTGKEQWRYEIGPMYPPQGGSEGGPNGMPVVADGMVYGLGAKGHLFALKLDDGSEAWKIRIDEAHGARAPMFGFSTVPLVAGDVLFVETGGDAGRSLTGFDRRTGKVRWSTGDDTAGYCSPILAKLAGVEQIVALTNRALYGLDPATGKVLWTHEHGLNTQGGGDMAGTPVLLDGDRFFVVGEAESKAFAVRQDAGAWKVEPAWTTRSLKGSLATPVFHEGHLYGFDGDFLTCISATDGEKVWKSRPPGGRGLVLVDARLLIFANDGSIVSADATPAGYVETGRLAVADAGTWTYPSFANGIVYVRNTTDLAAIATKAAVATAPAASASLAEPRSDFERFVRKVERAEAKRLLIDDFMAKQSSFPIVEDGWVHFVYRGTADDVAVTGSMTEYQVEESLEKIDGTDLFYRSYEAGPGTRWEYRYNVDFENAQPDPLNPRRVPGREGDLSEVTTAGFERSKWDEPYTGAKRGTIETFALASTVLGNEREVAVYLPAGYEKGSERYPVVIAIEGQDWRELGHLPNVLDHLTSDGAASVIVAFVGRPEGAPPQGRPEASADYARMLAEELVPKLDASYRTVARPDARAVLGTGTGGAAAAMAAVTRPDVFGKAAATSVFLGMGGNDLTAAIEAFDASKPKPVFAIAWSTNELRRTDWNADLARDSKKLAEQLEAKGFEVRKNEARDSSGWGGWPVRAAEMLVTLFPRG